MEFYRIEKNGHGPYCLGGDEETSISLMDWLVKNEYIDYIDRNGSFSDYMFTRPTQTRDATIYNFLYDKTSNRHPPDYLFGFISMDQLMDWFNGWHQMEYLSQFNYNLCLYETDDLCASDYQAVANKNSLILKEVIKI